jgi:hypothetical protein
MKVDFSQASKNMPNIIDTNPPSIFNIKLSENNWKQLLSVVIVVAVLATIYHKLKLKKEKKSNEKTKPLYYNLPKKSM